MKLSHVKFSGVRGLPEIAVPLSAATVVHGPNGSGKSTIGWAIALALTDPGEISVRSLTAEMAGAPALSVAIESETGVFGLGLGRGTGAAVKPFGVAPGANLVALDFARFEKMKLADRRSWLATLTGASRHLTAASLRVHILESLREDKKVKVPEVEAAIAFLTAAYGETEGLEIDRAQEARAKVEAEAKTYAKTVEALRSAASGSTVARAVSDAPQPAPRANAEALLEENQKAITAAETELAAIRSAQTRRAEHERQHRELSALSGREFTARRAEVEARRADMELRLSRAEVEAESCPTDAQIEAQVGKASAKVRELNQSIARAEAAVAAAVAKSKGFDRQLAELDAHQSCPFCRSAAPGWRNEVAASILEAKAGADGEVETSENQLTFLKADRDKAEAHLAEATEDMATSVATVTSIRLRVSTYRHALADAERELAALAEEERRTADAAARLQSMTAEPALDFEGEIARTTEKLTSLRANAETHRADVRRLIASRNDALRRRQAEAQIAETEAKADAYAFVAKAVKDRIREVASGGLEKLLHLASGLTFEVLGFELGFKLDEFGRKGETFKGLSEFSTGERVIALAALGIAAATLDTEAELRLVVCDELGVLDPEKRRAFLKWVGEHAEARGIQLLIFAPEPPPELPGLSLVAI